MADQDKLQLPDPNNVPVTFVNEVAAAGFLNGVINLTMAVARFDPVGTDVVPASIIAARLRMDLYCAQSLHALLGKIIEQNTKGPAQPAPKQALDS